LLGQIGRQIVNNRRNCWDFCRARIGWGEHGEPQRNPSKDYAELLGFASSPPTYASSRPGLPFRAGTLFAGRMPALHDAWIGAARRPHPSPVETRLRSGRTSPPPAAGRP
jgi:hypothetical protein